MARRRKSKTNIDGVVAVAGFLLIGVIKGIKSLYKGLESIVCKIGNWLVEIIDTIGIYGCLITLTCVIVVVICVDMFLRRRNLEKEQIRQAELEMMRRHEEVERKRREAEWNKKQAEEKKVLDNSVRIKKYAQIFEAFNSKVYPIDDTFHMTVNAKNIQQYNQLTNERTAALKRICSETELEKIKKIIYYLDENRAIMREVRSKYWYIPETDEELIYSTGLSVEEFRAIEKTIIDRKYRVKATENVKWIINIRYESPAGRNCYSSVLNIDSEMMRDFLSSEEAKTWRFDERKSERSKMNSSLRYDILKRDGFRCRLCGRGADDGVQLEVDHIIPISKGGKTERSNLRALCKDCNRGKSDKFE